jgi:ribosome biogenesis GTPase / thiamine phosphate phosphatase
MFDLHNLGMSPFFEEQLQHFPTTTLVPARIAAEHRGGYEVWSSAGLGPARLAGKLRHQLANASLPTAGDWVLLDQHPADGTTCTIRHLLERRTAFTRGAAGRANQVQVVAANVDRVFVVCGLDQDYQPNRIERYLARVWASEAEPIVVLNKADVCPEVAARVAEVEGRAGGAPVYATSATADRNALPAGCSAIAAIVHATVGCGQTAAFVGSSGAGKSTLINALLGEARLPTAATRAGDGRGCHTTTHRQLVHLPAGGLVLDTPGMRELQLVDDEGLGTVFDDLAALAATCRFADCTHAHEPGCAVKQAVADGSLDPARLEHYQKLQREAAAYERRHDERLRRQSERVWGQLHDEAARLRRWKGG